MGLLDRVKGMLTGSDRGRARTPRQEEESGGPGEADSAGAASGRGTPGEQPLAGEGRTHTVVRGDTLASIAERYGVDRRQMAELNGLDNPDLIYPGQVFRVPDA